MKNKFLNSFMNVYWLRPETALWRSVDALFLSKIKFENPALDLGCGDGVFSFISHGGKLDTNFDVFKQSMTKGFWENKDIYDYFDGKTKLRVKIKPKFVFDVGFDLKKNLLLKADLLGIYKKTVQGDANEKLPFKNNSFNFVFSNILYWIENLEGLMNELYRIIKPGGRLVVTVPTETWNKYLITYKLGKNSGKNIISKFFNKLNRGRNESYHHVYTPDQWKAIFNKHGFEIEKQERYLSKTLMVIWDVGLRPLSPITIRLEHFLDSLGIKKLLKVPWVFLFNIILGHFALLHTEEDKKYPPAFLGIVAVKPKKRSKQ